MLSKKIFGVILDIISGGYNESSNLGLPVIPPDGAQHSLPEHVEAVGDAEVDAAPAVVVPLQSVIRQVEVAPPGEL